MHRTDVQFLASFQCYLLGEAHRYNECFNLFLMLIISPTVTDYMIYDQKSMKREITIPLSLLFFCSYIFNPANSQVLLSTPLTNSSKRGNEITASINRKDDEIAIFTESNRIVVDIHSKSGISTTELSSVDGKWQRPIVLRLHLSGLENLTVTTGNLTISSSVLSHSGYRQLHSFSDGERTNYPVQEDDQFWMPITIINRKEPRRPVIPLEDGYFEVTIPDILLETNPDKLLIRWIDFYR